MTFLDSNIKESSITEKTLFDWVYSPHVSGHNDHPLHNAAQHGDVERVKALISARVDVDIRGFYVCHCFLDDIGCVICGEKCCLWTTTKKFLI